MDFALPTPRDHHLQFDVLTCQKLKLGLRQVGLGAPQIRGACLPVDVLDIFAEFIFAEFHHAGCPAHDVFEQVAKRLGGTPAHKTYITLAHKKT